MKITKDKMEEKIKEIVIRRDLKGTDDFIGELLTLFQKEKEEALKKQREEIRQEIYYLDWIKILSEAIEGRPTSFYKGRDAIMEWRNASDQILGTFINHAEQKGIFQTLKERLSKLSLDKEEKHE